jgi:hypothetical protein
MEAGKDFASPKFHPGAKSDLVLAWLSLDSSEF